MQKRFTLIELLVVVAILSVLLALLMPALKRAREQARRVACGSNQRQILLGLSLGATDRDARFPNFSQRGQSYGQSYSGLSGLNASEWLHDYLRITIPNHDWTFPLADFPDLLRCPSLPDRFRYFGDFQANPSYRLGERLNWPNDAPGVLWGYYSFLGLDSFWGYINNNPDPNGDGVDTRQEKYGVSMRNMPVTILERPKEDVLITDLVIETHYIYHVYTVPWESVYAGAVAHGTANDPDGSNHGYADGSVRWVPFDQFNRVIGHPQHRYHGNAMRSVSHLYETGYGQDDGWYGAARVGAVPNFAGSSGEEYKVRAFDPTPDP